MLDGQPQKAELRGLQKPASLGPASGGASAWTIITKSVQGVRCLFHLHSSDPSPAGFTLALISPLSPWPTASDVPHFFPFPSTVQEGTFLHIPTSAHKDNLCSSPARDCC